jgi:hypothetical protein
MMNLDASKPLYVGEPQAPAGDSDYEKDAFPPRKSRRGGAGVDVAKQQVQERYRADIRP